MDEYQDWWDSPFEPTQFDSWSYEDRNYAYLYHEEEEDPTQGDEIRTPWGGCVD